MCYVVVKGSSSRIRGLGNESYIVHLAFQFFYLSRQLKELILKSAYNSCWHMINIPLVFACCVVINIPQL